MRPAPIATAPAPGPVSAGKGLVWLPAAACAAVVFLAAATVRAEPAGEEAAKVAAAGPPPFTKVLVLGAGRDGAARRLFEDALVAELAKAKTGGVPAYTVIPGMVGLEVEPLRAAVAKAGADGLLLARVVSAFRDVKQEKGSTTFVTVLEETSYAGLFYTDFFKIVEEAHLEEKGPVKVKVEARLYAAAGERLRWSGAVELERRGNLEEATRRAAKALVDGLVTAGKL